LITLPNGKSIHAAYHRNINIVNELVATAEEYAYEQIFMALNVKGAFS
jgi:hypothetical protein